MAVFPKFEVTVVQVEPLVEVRIWPTNPPATQRLLPKAMEDILVGVTVVQVVASVEVRTWPPPATQRLFPWAMENMIDVPKFEFTVVQVVALVEVRIWPE